MRYSAILVLVMGSDTLADIVTIGPDGIDSAATALNGAGIEIGQLEGGRSGKPNYGLEPEPSASNTKPRQVYFRTRVANPQEGTDDHATEVAGVMIGDDTVGGGLFEGVAPGAYLHSAAVGSMFGDEFSSGVDVEFALTADRLARLTGFDHIDPNHFRRMRAINISATRALQGQPGDQNDGNSHMTLFVDWSAQRHDVLYVCAWGNDTSAPQRAPTDNFNGMVVAASQQVNPNNGDAKYRKFGTVNSTIGFLPDGRNPISLLAPGEPVRILGLGDNGLIGSGTSVATPHVTGTAALLQQHAKPKVEAGNDPRWNQNAQHHEVMKAVMMNAADKLEGVHGSTRTVLDVNNFNWLQSGAYNSDAIPIDAYMGAGHLNARRSLQQYESGEYNPGMVPSIAWDYHGVGNIEEYVFDSMIGPGYIAATLAWDRRVEKTGGPTYLEGDQFIHEDPADRLNNLDLYLMPAASNDLNDAIAKSISAVQNLEHIFFNIETAGQYKLVVHNNPQGGVGDTQAYALAWWFGDAPPDVVGDYDNDGDVDEDDYIVWTEGFGSSISPGDGADGNSDGIVDAADYVVWRKFADAAGSGSQVPEPRTMMLFAITCIAICDSRWLECRH